MSVYKFCLLKIVMSAGHLPQKVLNLSLSLVWLNKNTATIYHLSSKTPEYR